MNFRIRSKYLSQCVRATRIHPIVPGMEICKQIFEEQVTFGNEGGPKEGRVTTYYPVYQYKPEERGYMPLQDSRGLLAALDGLGLPSNTEFAMRFLIRHDLLKDSEDAFSPLLDPGIDQQIINDRPKLVQDLAEYWNCGLEVKLQNLADDQSKVRPDVAGLIVNITAKRILCPDRSVSTRLMRSLRLALEDCHELEEVQELANDFFQCGRTYGELSAVFYQLLKDDFLDVCKYRVRM